MGLAVMVAALVCAQGFAVITGLASGRIEAAGFPWILVLSFLVIYVVMLVGLCVTGVAVVRKMFGKGPLTGPLS